ncbi:MAG: protease-4 [Saprospiraceae bacterium]|jgi:protease-4
MNNNMNTFKYIKIGVIALVLIASTITIWDQIEYRFGLGIWADDGLYSEESDGEVGFLDASCTVAGVQFHGALYTYYDQESQAMDDVSTSEDIAYYLSVAEDASNIEVILLEIDSYGGSPVAAQEVVETMQKYVTKPIVVQIREAGDSAGYYVASAGDHIIASALSDVGSIGVTMSYVDASDSNKKEGYTYNQISTGKFKDSGDPQKMLTTEEKALFQRDVDITHEAFVQTVATNRSMDIESVRALADGSAMLGEMALEKGLIDQVGGYYDVLEYIEGEYYVDPVVCW